MSTIVLRCPMCDQPARVGARTIGHVVACPRCGARFPALPDSYLASDMPRPVAQVGIGTMPGRGEPTRTTWNAHLHDDHHVLTNPALKDDDHAVDHTADHAHNASHGIGLLLAFSLLPLGVPLIWLAATQFVAKPTGFSFMLPIAIGLGFSGLCLGLGHSRWPHARRVVSVLLLVGMAYLIAGLLFIFKLASLELADDFIRKGLGQPALLYRFEPDPADLRPTDMSFEVKFPGPPKKMDTQPLPGFSMKAVRDAEPERGRTDEFVVAYGRIADRKDWHELVNDALAASSGGTIAKSSDPFSFRTYPAREWLIDMPNTSRRYVRAVKVGFQLFYLSAEGPTIGPESEKVNQFYDSFRIVPVQPKKR